MITWKYIDRLVLVITALGLTAVLIVLLFVSPLSAAQGLTMEYESQLFDTAAQPLSIDIQIDADEWQDLLDNAINEEYYACDVIINGTTFYNVGIRAKGNTSLSTVYNDPDTQRYSFKLEFDRYVTGQTCWGLDKLVLNNNYADATSMKEAIVYDMFAFLGADAPLYHYADLSVNGETWGCYLALEAVEDSFALRNYGVSSGALYKPESMGVGGAGKMRDFNSEELQELMEQMGIDPDSLPDDQQFPNHPDNPDGTVSDSRPIPPTNQQNGQLPAHRPGKQGQFPVQNIDGTSDNNPPPADGDGASDGLTPPTHGGGPGGPGDMSGGGADLNYVDDELDSYSTIWDGEITSTSKADHQRVVKALKNISEGTSLETSMDIDNLLRYLAVQTFVVNLDGLAGNMTHNYYLYEKNGQLNLIPWDYNLAFGGFHSSSTSSTVNFPIDTPFTTGLEDRQFFAALLENETYLAQYHDYLRQLAEEYVDGGIFADTVSRIRGQIDTLVANDPTAFYTAEEYNTAVTMLETVVTLRAESVLGQLDGTIPATTDGQNTDSSTLINCDDVDLSVMGTMMGGGNHGFRSDMFPDNAMPLNNGKTEE